jgi:hypothetical protein
MRDALSDSEARTANRALFGNIGLMIAHSSSKSS